MFLGRVSPDRIAHCGELGNPILALEGNQLISLRSRSTSDPRTTGRLLMWAVATTVACGAVGLSGSTAAGADTAMTKTAPTGQQDGNPWLDSDDVSGLPAPFDANPVVFYVTANGGVPWVYDPREPSGQPRWQNLRRVPGSQGGYVVNISVAQGDNSLSPVVGTTHSLKITARTVSGLFSTTCGIATAATNTEFPTVGPLTNCTEPFPT